MAKICRFSVAAESTFGIGTSLLTIINELRQI